MWVGADFMATTKRETCAQLKETYTMACDVTLHMQLWWFPAHSVLSHSEKRPADYLWVLPPLSQCDVMLESCVCVARALSLSAGRDPLTSTNYTAKLHMTERPRRTWWSLTMKNLAKQEYIYKSKPRLKDVSLWKLHMTDSILRDIKLNIPFPFCSLLSLAKYHSHFICYICSNQNLFRLSPQMVCQHSRGEVKVNTHT